MNVRRRPASLLLPALAAVFALLCTQAYAAPSTPAPVAAGGVITLGEQDLRRGTALAGEWQFAWERFIGPQDAAAAGRGGDWAPITVPGSWNVTDAKYTPVGYATYRLVVNLPSGTAEPIGILLKNVSTAYRLYGNGELLLEDGVASENAAATRGTYAPRSAYFEAAGRVELLIQVSNVEDTLAGLQEAPFLGLQAAVLAAASRDTLLDAIIYAAVLIMGLYHILLAIIHPDERASLWFGILAVILALRGALTGARLIHQVASGLGFHTLLAAEFITVYLAGLAVYLYFCYLFPKERIRYVLGPVLVVSSAFSVFAVFAPISLITTVHIYYEIFLLCEGLLIVTWIVRSLVARRDGALMVLMGFVVLLGAAAYDVVIDVLNNGALFLTAYAIVVFVFLQAVLIAHRYTVAYLSARDQSIKAEGLATSLARFVPKEFLGLLGKESIEHVNLGDQVELEMTVLFSDIRAFSTLSESMTPAENFNFLNSYLSRISPVIRRNRGFIDKYLGDGIMALFPRKPGDAVRAGLEMMDTVRVFNGHRAKSGYRPIGIGVGINTGKLMLGTVGESSRMEGTVISDTVNLASRLEGLTRTFGSWIIVSEHLLQASPEVAARPHRRLGRVKVKGMSRAVTVFEILDTPDLGRINTLDTFEEGLRSFEAHRYPEAAEAFRRVLGSDPADQVAEMYLRKIAEVLRSRPRAAR